MSTDSTRHVYHTLRGHEVVPATHEEWGQLWERGPDARRVAYDRIGDVEVSTVFLGLDHGFGDGSPLFFETMIFHAQHDQEQWRYTTWEEAEAGHQEVVGALRRRRPERQL